MFPNGEKYGECTDGLTQCFKCAPPAPVRAELVLDQWRLCVCLSASSAVGQFVRVSGGRVQRQGVGVHYSSDGSVFSGAWSGDRMNGQGECIHGNGIKYKVLILSSVSLYCVAGSSVHMRCASTLACIVCTYLLATG